MTKEAKGWENWKEDNQNSGGRIKQFLGNICTCDCFRDVWSTHTKKEVVTGIITGIHGPSEAQELWINHVISPTQSGKTLWVLEKLRSSLHCMNYVNIERQFSSDRQQGWSVFWKCFQMFIHGCCALSTPMQRKQLIHMQIALNSAFVCEITWLAFQITVPHAVTSVVQLPPSENSALRYIFAKNNSIS